MNAPGLLTGSSGYIQNPTQLLQRIEDGLSVFNETPDPLIDLLCEDHFELETSVDQAPSDFEREGEGSLPGAQKLQWRDLKFPLETFDMRTSWTKTGLEDSREDRVLREANAAMKGWAVREVGLLAAAIFRNRTAGAIGTAYEASFYNGETDVPPFLENSFASAHSHYRGINTTTLARSHILTDIENVAEHGFSPNMLLASPYQHDDLLAIMDPGSGNLINTPERQKAIDDGILAGGVKVCGLTIFLHSAVPAGYYSVIDTRQRPIGRRLHDKAENRGLRIERGTQPDNPLVDAYFRARVGYRVRILGAATASQIVASTSYTNPTMRLQ